MMNFGANFIWKFSELWWLSTFGGFYYYFELIIDGVSQFSILNKNAKRFYNVKMYASDPWHQAFTSHFGWISAIKTQEF